jgi:hypothetical protein
LRSDEGAGRYARARDDKLDLFLFLVGSGLAFTVVEAVVSRGFRLRMREERSDVVILGSAMNLIFISAGFGVIVGAGMLLPVRMAWFGGGLTGTLTYLLVGGIELALARRAQGED